MVKIVNLPEIAQRFINREQLDQIKSRIGRIPFGQYYTASEKHLCVRLLDDQGTPSGSSNIAVIEYPGATDFFLHMKQDVESLIRHVENADIENDLLLIRIKELEDKIIK